MRILKTAAAASALAVALAAGAVAPVAAAPYAITYTGTLSNSGSADFINGQTYDVTLVFDNGGSTAASQTWTGANLTCVVWRFNDARNVVYTQDLIANPPQQASGSVTTDAAGALVTNFSTVLDRNVSSGFTYSGADMGSYNWFANNNNAIFATRGVSNQVSDPRGGVQMAPVNWSNPTPFAGAGPGTGAGCAAAVIAPAITGLNPTGGPAAGGVTVVITGTAFTGATAVTFGANPATSFTVDSATQITAVAPAGMAGSTVRVTVTTPSGATPDTAADDFTYAVAPVPTLSEWAMMLFGGLLAAGAAVTAGRRRRLG